MNLKKKCVARFQWISMEIKIIWIHTVYDEYHNIIIIINKYYLFLSTKFVPLLLYQIKDYNPGWIKGEGAIQDVTFKFQRSRGSVSLTRRVNYF